MPIHNQHQQRRSREREWHDYDQELHREHEERERFFGPQTLGRSHSHYRSPYETEPDQYAAGADGTQVVHPANGWGRGPKGYRRSDERINEDVCDRLTYSPVDASEVEVQVRDGEVTLTGTVRARWEKRQAEDLTASVRGVIDVHNQLRITRS